MLIEIEAAAPIVAVDDLVVSDAGSHLAVTAHKAIDADDPQLAAHFPAFKIFPGVFVLEALRQAVSAALGDPALGIGAVTSIRFLAPLCPGDRVTLRAVIQPARDGGRRVEAEALRRDGVVAARLKVDVVSGAAAGVPDHAAVRALLPHGHPMVLVDRIETLEPGRSIRAVKAVTATEPCYRRLGRDAAAWQFAYPASMLLESFGQAAALLWMTAVPERRPEDVIIFVGARGCRIDGAAYPGDVMTHVARIDYAADTTAIVSGETRVAGRRIASFESMTACLRSHATLVATQDMESTHADPDR